MGLSRCIRWSINGSVGKSIGNDEEYTFTNLGTLVRNQEIADGNFGDRVYVP